MTEILFDGDKTFWNERCKLDIYMVVHIKYHCIEMVCFEVSSSQEYPRIYLDYVAMKAMIPLDKFRLLLHNKKELYKKEKMRLTNKSLDTEAWHELIAQYILSHCSVAIDENGVTVHLFDEDISNVSDTKHLFREKPTGLEPVTVRRNKVQIAGDTDEKFLQVVSVSAIGGLKRNNTLLKRTQQLWRILFTRIMSILRTHKAIKRIETSCVAEWYRSRNSSANADHEKLLKRLLAAPPLSKQEKDLQRKKHQELWEAKQRERKLKLENVKRRGTLSSLPHLQGIAYAGKGGSCIVPDGKADVMNTDRRYSEPMPLQLDESETNNNNNHNNEVRRRSTTVILPAITTPNSSPNMSNKRDLNTASGITSPEAVNNSSPDSFFSSRRLSRQSNRLSSMKVASAIESSNGSTDNDNTVKTSGFARALTLGGTSATLSATSGLKGSLTPRNESTVVSKRMERYSLDSTLRGNSSSCFSKAQSSTALSSVGNSTRGFMTANNSVPALTLQHSFAMHVSKQEACVPKEAFFIHRYRQSSAAITNAVTKFD